MKICKTHLKFGTVISLFFCMLIALPEAYGQTIDEEEKIEPSSI